MFKQVWNVSNNSQLDKFNIYRYHICLTSEKLRYRNQTNLMEFLEFFSLMGPNMLPLDIQLLFDLRGESWKKAYMKACSILISIQCFVKFQTLDPKIQMKRAKRLLLTYFHTHRVSYNLCCASFSKYSFSTKNVHTISFDF